MVNVCIYLILYGEICVGVEEGGEANHRKEAALLHETNSGQSAIGSGRRRLL